jgi:hypothetical protein
MGFTDYQKSSFLLMGVGWIMYTVGVTSANRCFLQMGGVSFLAIASHFLTIFGTWIWKVSMKSTGLINDAAEIFPDTHVISLWGYLAIGGGIFTMDDQMGSKPEDLRSLLKLGGALYLVGSFSFPCTHPSRIAMCMILILN